MRSIAVAAVWLGIGLAFTQAVSTGLEAWKVGDRDPYAEWVPPNDQRSLRAGSRPIAKPVPSIATSPAGQRSTGIEG